MLVNPIQKTINQRLSQRPIKKESTKKETIKPTIAKSHIIVKKAQKRINNENDQGVMNKENPVKRLSFNNKEDCIDKIKVNNDSNVKMIADKDDSLIYKEIISTDKIDTDCDMASLNEFRVDEETDKTGFQEIKNLTLKQSVMNANIKESNSNHITLNYTNLMINKQNKPDFTMDEYRTALTKSIKKDYGTKIIDTLFEEEEPYDDFLRSHKITERMRMRMVDWMIEVLSNYKCDNNTFFIAVGIMDKYFKLLNKPINPGELHLIGVASMFMASKYQDIYPLRLRIIYEKIAHKKLSIQEIKNKEQDISQVLGYMIGKPTSLDFVLFYYDEIFFTKYNDYQINDKKLMDHCELISKKDAKHKINSHIKTYTPNMLILLKEVIVYLLKMNCHDYALSCKKPSLLAASSLFVAMKICEQINKEDYVNEYFTSSLIEISKIPENEIIKVAQKILYNAQNFDNIFSNLENLKKVHFNAIIELKNTK